MIATHNFLIEIPQWDRVTLVEALWLASGLMALFFATIRFRSLWEDYQVAKRVGEEDLCIIAYGYLRREVLRIIAALSVTFIGFWVCANYPTIPGPAKINLSGLFLTIGLFIISLTISTQSILDWRDRNKTIELITKRNRA